MNNYIIIFLLILGVAERANAQEVVASAGETQKAADIELSWTLGETIIETAESGSSVLTQGFHQSKLVVTALDDIIANFEVKVYPNPTSDFVIVNLDATKYDTQYALFDFSGKLLRQHPISETETRLDMIRYASGTYILKLLDDNSLPLQSFKIVKR